MKKRISNYISLLLILSSFLLTPFSGYGQVHKAASKEAKEEKKEEVPFYQGTSIGVEIAGLVSNFLGSDIMSSEVAVQANFKNRFLPVVEIGYGKADAINDGNDLHYKTSAPYFRIGMDYNFTKKWYTGNRLYLGIRYAFTSFKYDISSPGFADPVWGNEVPFVFNGLSANSHWGEIVFGIETRIWKIFHLGWNVRYKIRMSHSEAPQGSPWYVPGFGKYGNSCIGGTFNIIFDI